MLKSRWTKCVASAAALGACLLLLASPAAAQTTASASIDATASVIGNTPIDATGEQPLNFGAVLAGTAVLVDPATQASQTGLFRVTGEPSAPISVNFGLPTELTGPGDPITINFAGTDGLEWSAYPTAYTTFDPHVAYNTAITGAGDLFVGIAGNITVGSGPGVISGVYTGTIVLDVAYIGT